MQPHDEIIDLKTQLNLAEAKNRELTRHIQRLIRENMIYHEGEENLFQCLKLTHERICSDICSSSRHVDECLQAAKLLAHYGHAPDGVPLE